MTPSRRTDGISYHTRSDARAFLGSDLRTVSRLLARVKHTRTATKKRAIVETICRTLAIQVQLEEEILSPTLRGKPRGREMLAEISGHHANLKRLIADVQGVEPDDEFELNVVLIAAEIRRLEDLRDQHPGLARASTQERRALGARLAMRRRELLESNERIGGWD
jgi:hypothetical protein